ncbi:MAG: alpha/beta fold hydrolase, partial [Candidatus Binatia bacterium]
HGHAWSSEVMETMDAAEKAAREGGRDAAIEVLLDRPVFASAKDDPEALAVLREQLQRNYSIETNHVRALRPLAVGRLSELRMPVLVLTGGDPGADARAIAERLVGDAARARRETVEGAGHMMNLERPREFNRAVERFLDACPLRPQASEE